MLKKDNNKYSGFYRGYVVDNNDPDKKGRVKVRIHPCFDGVEAEYLPWATLATPLVIGSGAAVGNFSLPQNDTWVWCFFETGDFNQPVIFAEAVTAVHGIPTSALTNYPNAHVLKLNNIEVILDDSSGNVTISGNDFSVTGNDINVSGKSITVTGSGAVKITGSSVNINT